MNRDTRLIAFALFLWGFGEGLFVYIQPLYFEQLGANPVQIGGLLSAAAAVSAVSFLPAGIISDYLPRKWVMWWGWMLGVIGILLVALAHTWQGLIPGLLLYTFSAYCIPAINSYIAHSVNGRNLESIYTTVFAGYSAGGTLSPAIGGWLAQATDMRTVYFAAAAVYSLSTVIMLFVSPQPVQKEARDRPRWDVVLNRRYLTFAGLTWFAFVAMAIAIPLTPNFLADIRHWDVGRVGSLGTFTAAGAVLLNLLLGRLSKNAPRRGLVVGQVLLWSATLLLLLTGAFPVLALVYLLRGAYGGCRSLTQARASSLGDESTRGLLLGATETTMSSAQVAAPYIAGWLYAGNPYRPLWASLILIPLALLLSHLFDPR